jgi:hypothetical protein
LEWDDLIPEYDNIPFHAQRFKSFLYIGTTISIVPPLTVDRLFVWSKTNLIYSRIVCQSPDETNIVTRISINSLLLFDIFIPFHNFFGSGGEFPIMEDNLRNVTELLQTNYSINIPVHDIYDICFIFTQVDVDVCTTFLQGLVNSLFIQFRCNLTTGQHHPLPLNTYFV